ncbi:MAG: hypothetical protein ABSG51_00960 [Terracidiphilus sp.]|jgi:hypothetical protein
MQKHDQDECRPFPQCSADSANTSEAQPAPLTPLIAYERYFYAHNA